MLTSLLPTAYVGLIGCPLNLGNLTVPWFSWRFPKKSVQFSGVGAWVCNLASRRPRDGKIVGCENLSIDIVGCGLLLVDV